MGVIAVETRSVDVSIPADPANTDSEAKVHNDVCFVSNRMCQTLHTLLLKLICILFVLLIVVH